MSVNKRMGRIQGEDIEEMWMPRAEEMEWLIRPLLLRSFDAWLGNRRKDVTSAYMDGNILVVTAALPCGRPMQLVLLKEEIPDLPPIIRSMLEADLKRPGVRGFVITQPR